MHAKPCTKCQGHKEQDRSSPTHMVLTGQRKRQMLNNSTHFVTDMNKRDFTALTEGNTSKGAGGPARGMQMEHHCVFHVSY